MKPLLLFDAETQHYRQAIYRYFEKEFARQGYQLTVVYDTNRNRIEHEGLFLGISYSLTGIIRTIRAYRCRLVILFIWMRYRFLIPLMVFNRLSGVRMITWSHGVNLQKQDQWLKNQLYYLRQRLANGLIIFSPNERHFIHASHRKLFVANNTLNFQEFPLIPLSREQLKEKYGLKGKKVVLCVGRHDQNKRKPELLLNGFTDFQSEDIILMLVGPGIPSHLERRMSTQDNIRVMGAIYAPQIINEIFKMSDVFCMPGAIGLAINQAFHYGLPVVAEDVAHGPEGHYLKPGSNGFLFRAGDHRDMMEKVTLLCHNDEMRNAFAASARKTIIEEGSMDGMFRGFLEAVKYVDH